MSAKGRRIVFLVAMAALAAIFLPKIALADTALYREWLTPVTLVVVGSSAKLCFLIVGAVVAWRCAQLFGAHNPARAGWRLLSLGLAIYAAGQASLGAQQIFRGSLEVPYPSIADVLFVLSMLGLIAALFVFVFAYRSAGYLGRPGRVLAVAALSTVAVAALLALLLKPVLAEPAPAAEQALNLAYPVLDCLLVLPALILLRMALDLRGGRLLGVWLLLLGGFLFVAAGDVLFAYLTTLGMTALDPLVDLVFAYGYLFLAWGTLVQRSILAE